MGGVPHSPRTAPSSGTPTCPWSVGQQRECVLEQIYKQGSVTQITCLHRLRSRSTSIRPSRCRARLGVRLPSGAATYELP